MKKLYFLMFFLCTFAAFGQLTVGSSNTASVSADLPNITPPSPTVASLMKFEEVPVDHYTGVPDISIPIYSVPTLSGDISINVGLQYHPASIAVKEVASFTGLGWNLMAGGTISRTVMGLPDEIYQTKVLNGSTTDKVGIYNNDVSHLTNLFYNVLNLTATNSQRGEFFWQAFEKSILDSEHDLYQYNFMGHSGRFYLRKNGNNLEVVKLDNDNSLKIEVSFVSTPGQLKRFSLTSFTIYDDKGYKYVFSAKEVSTEERSSWAQPFGQYGSNPGTTDTITYDSSFHLTQIQDNNGQVLATFSYQNSIEVVAQSSKLYNYISDPLQYTQLMLRLEDLEGGVLIGVPPNEAGNGSIISIVTKKLAQIDVKNKAKIDFELESGRQDANIMSGGSKLKSVTVRNYLGEQVKKVSFAYTYLQVGIMNNQGPKLKRLGLSKVEESNPFTSEILSYVLSYKSEIHSVVHNLREDYWGYFRRGGFGKKTDPDYCTIHVLTDMTLPTKGTIHFDFEPNTYSYIGNTALTEFDNSTSYTDDIFTFTVNPGQTVSNPLIVSPINNQNISFEPEAPAGSYYFRMAVQSTGEERPIDVIGMERLNDGTGTSEPIAMKAGETYAITLHRRDTVGLGTGRLLMRRPTPEPPSTFKGIYGGGVRIKNIQYISNDTIKEKHYAYNFFDDPDRTSGSLVFAKPLFEYGNAKNYLRDCPICSGASMFGITYMTQTSFNNLLGIRTKGSDVGYKNVTVWETANGKSEYVYTSPIDYPETNYTISYPFRPSSNVDYKRGLLTNEKHYSQKTNAYTLLSESIYSYPEESMDEMLVATGMRVYNSGSCPISPMYNSWQVFLSCVNNPQCYSATQGVCEPDVYLNFGYMNTAYGWPKLTTQTNKEYFYHVNGDAAKTVSTTQTFEYNAQNKRISKTTATNSLGDVLATEYTYDTNAGTNNRIGEIKSVETKRNSDVLDKKEVTYSNSLWGTTNTAYLPSTVAIGKGSTTPEVRLRFVKYDEYSNPVEATLENGTPVVYIWGYNNSLPIALIENMAYDDINSTLITNVQNASAQNLSYNESTLLTKLAELRAGLPVTAMVTTYTHKPLVGITTATDAKGLFTRYHYDEFNRLWKTTDKEGFILSENKYNYKPGF